MAAVINIFSSDIRVLEANKNLLLKSGFKVNTYCCVTEKNINLIYKNNPDLILLDLNISNSDGIEFCHQLKSENKLSSFVVLFTNHQEEYIQIEAFKAGADDYIIRPVNSMVLVKKINTLLKRKSLNTKIQNPKIITYNQLKIDRESYLVFYNNKPLSLPKKQFEILYLLLQTPQKIFTREEILNLIWQEQNKINTRIIDVHIRKIREKIGGNIIKTIKGLGYQLAKQ